MCANKEVLGKGAVLAMLADTQAAHSIQRIQNWSWIFS